MDILSPATGSHLLMEWIGCTVKRVTAKQILQQPLNDQILDCVKMFDFCKNGAHLPNIEFIFISIDEMKELR